MYTYINYLSLRLENRASNVERSEIHIKRYSSNETTISLRYLSEIVFETSCSEGTRGHGSPGRRKTTVAPSAKSALVVVAI